MDATVKSQKNYNLIQEKLDRIIGMLGSQRTLHLLESFINKTTLSVDEPYKIKLITDFVMELAVKGFDLKAEHFLTSGVREYRDARMCCFHLLRKYTGTTFSKIGLAFQRSERIVTYGFEVIESRLAFEKGNAAFNRHYRQLESTLIEFIGKL